MPTHIKEYFDLIGVVPLSNEIIRDILLQDGKLLDLIEGHLTLGFRHEEFSFISILSMMWE